MHIRPLALAPLLNYIDWHPEDTRNGLRNNPRHEMNTHHHHRVSSSFIIIAITDSSTGSSRSIMRSSSSILTINSPGDVTTPVPSSSWWIFLFRRRHHSRNTENTRRGERGGDFGQILLTSLVRRDVEGDTGSRAGRGYAKTTVEPSYTLSSVYLLPHSDER